MPKFLNPCADTIGWADYTWNPVTGCLHGPEICSCSEKCYARALARRFGKTEDEKNFLPAFHPERLAARFDLIPPSRIFVGSNADLFGDWVPREWIEAILEVCAENPQHRFLFLTKNSRRYWEFKFPSNCWLGQSITKEPKLNQLHFPPRLNMFISIEPYLGPIYQLPLRCEYCEDWIIVGAQTPYSAKTAPKPEWVQATIEFSRKYNISLYLKDSLRWPEVIKEFPEGLKV